MNNKINLGKDVVVKNERMEIPLIELKKGLEEEKYVFTEEELNDQLKINEVCYKITKNGILTDVASRFQSISKIVIPMGVIKITSGAFKHFNNFAEISLPSTLRYIAPNAFSNCSSLTSLVVPSSVEEIGEYAFSNCESLKAITLSKRLKKINEGTFEGCAALEEIVLPSSVSYIGYSAFSGCESLQTLKCDNNNIQVDEGFVSGCESLQYLLNEPFTEDELISEDTIFAVLRSGEEYEIPENVKRIGIDAFRHCNKLKSITVPGNAVIGDGAFRDCENLDNAYLDVGIKEVPSFCFANDKKLRLITLHHTTTVINSYAFANCTSLKSLHIGERIEKMGDMAFYNCTSLKIDYLPAYLKSIGKGCFKNCKKLFNIIIPENIKVIKSGTFCETDTLRNLVFPDTLELIESGAFSSSNGKLDSIIFYETGKRKKDHVLKIMRESNDQLASVKEFDKPKDMKIEGLFEDR